MRRILTSVGIAGLLTSWVFLVANLFSGSSRPLPESIQSYADRSVFHEQLHTDEELAARHRLQAKLDQPAQLEFVDARLNDIGAYLSTEYDIDVLIDHQSLNWADLDPAKSLTVSLPEVRLRSALTLMLEAHQLTWATSDGTVRILAPEYHRVPADVSFIDATHLAQSPYDPDQLDIETLPDAITRFVDTSSWSDYGGDGSVSFWHGSLVVHQQDAVARDVDRLLAALNQAADDYRRDPAETVGRVYCFDASLSAAADQQIQAALERELPAMQFSDTPLGAVIRWLRQRTDAPLVMAPVPSDMLQNPANSLISISFDGERLRDVLPPLLARQNLAVQPRHDVLYIDFDHPTADDITRIYPVADLVDPNASDDELFWPYRGEVSPIETLFHEAIEAAGTDRQLSLTDVIHLDSIDVALVEATPETQRWLQTMLAQLRSARGDFDYAAHARQLRAARTGPVALTYQTSFDLTAADAKSEVLVIERILSQLPPELAERITIRVNVETLSIRATAADHRRLAEEFERKGLPLWRHGFEPRMAPFPGCGSLVPVVG